jgi:peptide/nickel transport system substrate-binding protein
MTWTTNRRKLLQTGGAMFAGLATVPQLAWSAEGGTLRLRMSSDFQVIDPYSIIGALDDVIPRCCQVTLKRIGDMRAGNPLTLHAAEEMEWIAPDALSFRLREGLVWTNGFGPVTADDVKFSFERIAGSDSAWSYQFDMLDEVEVTGERTGVIRLTDAFAPFEVIALPYYGGHILSRAAVEGVGGFYTTESPAECGPFLMDSWEQNQRVVLRANPDWTGETPDFDRIEVLIVPDDQAALLAYEARSYNFSRLATASLRQLRDNPVAGATVIEAPSTSYTWMTVNMNAVPLRDARVREAIQHAFDAESVLQGAYDGAVERGAGVIPPSSPFARPSNIIATRDVARARELLAEAGAEDLTLTLHCLTDSSSLATAQIIQATMAEAGITIEIMPVEDAVYWTLGDKESGDGYLDIELVLMTFAGGVEPTENLVWFLPDQIGVYNWSHFDEPEFEELFYQVQIEADADERKRLFNRMEDLMEMSGGFVFIAFEPYVAIHDADIEPMILSDGHPDPARFRKL